MAGGTSISFHRRIQAASLGGTEHKNPGRKTRQRGRAKRSRRSCGQVFLDNAGTLIDGATNIARAWRMVDFHKSRRSILVFATFKARHCARAARLAEPVSSRSVAFRGRRRAAATSKAGCADRCGPDAGRLSREICAHFSRWIHALDEAGRVVHSRRLPLCQDCDLRGPCNSCYR
jgi:hypothetical protein